jgi:hypothetical protein
MSRHREASTQADSENVRSLPGEHISKTTHFLLARVQYGSTFENSVHVHVHEQLFSKTALLF